jgi:pimeloyl-ACP methyl ester carboxylesterase
MLIIALHGYPLDRRMWSPLATALGDVPHRAVRLFTPDLRGRGTSRRPTADVHTMSLLADDLAADIAELLPESEPFLLAGFSMGGYVLFEFLRRHQARLKDRIAGLVLCDTKITADDDAGKAKRAEAIAAIRSRGIEAALEAMLPKLLARSSKGTENEAAVRRMILDTPPETACADLAGMAARIEGFDALAHFSAPVLLIVGEEDVITPASDAEAMAESAANSSFVRLLTIPGAGHLSPFEKPRPVAEAIEKLLGRLAAAK